MPTKQRSNGLRILNCTISFNVRVIGLPFFIMISCFLCTIYPYSEIKKNTPFWEFQIKIAPEICQVWE